MPYFNVLRQNRVIFNCFATKHAKDVRSGRPFFCNQPPRGPESEPERARVSQRELEWASFEYDSVLSRNVKIRYFLSRNVRIRYFLSRNVKIRYFLSWNVKIRYFLSRNVKIRAMSRKNGINYATSWLRIFYSPVGMVYSPVLFWLGICMPHCHNSKSVFYSVLDWSSSLWTVLGPFWAPWVPISLKGVF